METHLKLSASRYNYFSQHNDGILGYNARTGAIAILTKQIADQLKDGYLQFEKEEIIRDLLDMGFLHFGDEVELIGNKYEKFRESQDNINITIAPTITCNFSCSYCFQNEYRSKGEMNEETQENIVKLSETLVHMGRHKVSLTWFGGEPLLAPIIIKNLTEKISKKVEAAGGKVIYKGIITNGSLLSEDNINILNQSGIDNIQVTIDAFEFKQPVKRGVVNKSGSASIILENVKRLSDKVNVSIRVNVSANNFSEIPQIISFLEDYGFKDKYYLSRVEDDTEDLSRFLLKSEIETQHTISREQYADLEKKILLEHGNIRTIIKALTPKNHSCGATAGTMLVINYNGDISRCWMSAGNSQETISNINSLSDISSLWKGKNSDIWNTYSPLDDPECKKCKVLPLCMGGCTHSRNMRGSEYQACQSIRENISAYVNYLGNVLKVNKDA